MPNGQVVYLAEYRDQELLRVCRAIKRRAERGAAKGLLFVLVDERGGVDVGAVGSYCNDPRTALRASTALLNALNEVTAANGTGSK